LDRMSRVAKEAERPLMAVSSPWRSDTLSGWY
jgi:hypothetical protein